MAKGIDTKEKIIAKSAELFNLYGYHRCSLQDIMVATNLKKGGIYNHFNNKDEIAIAAFDYSFKKIFTRFRERLEVCKNSSEKLEVILRTFEDYVENPILEGGCPIVNTAIDTTDAYPLLRQKAKSALTKLENYIAIKLREGVENQEFRKSIECEDIAAFLVATLEGAVLMTRLNSDKKYIRLAIKNLKNYIEREIKN